MILILLNLWGFILLPSIWYLLENIPCGLKIICILPSLAGIFHRYQLAEVSWEFVQVFYILAEFLPSDPINY